MWGREPSLREGGCMGLRAFAQGGRLYRLRVFAQGGDCMGCAPLLGVRHWLVCQLVFGRALTGDCPLAFRGGVLTCTVRKTPSSLSAAARGGVVERLLGTRPFDYGAARLRSGRTIVWGWSSLLGECGWLVCQLVFGRALTGDCPLAFRDGVLTSTVRKTPSSLSAAARGGVVERLLGTRPFDYGAARLRSGRAVVWGCAPVHREGG